MKYIVIIPAHNEELYIQDCINSIIAQTRKPDTLIVVNDGSNDNTGSIIDAFAEKHDFIQTLHLDSKSQHLPGQKVVNAFYEGFNLVHNYDILMKMDADIILPPDYFKTVENTFQNDLKIGVCGGLLYIQKDNQWIYENIASKAHVRGPIKSYRKACFDEIGGLKSALGWDTADVLLARCYNWKVQTIPSLFVKHLKPTGFLYQKNKASNLGKVFYSLRYRYPLSTIAAFKSSIKAKSIVLFFKIQIGFFKAIANRRNFIVSPSEGKFIRRFYWKRFFNRFQSKK